MSAMKDIITGGADCSGSNNPLGKLIPQITGASMRENQMAQPIQPQMEEDFRTMSIAEEPQMNFDFHNHSHFMRDGPMLGKLTHELGGMSMHLGRGDLHQDFVQEFQHLSLQEPGTSRFHMEAKEEHSMTRTHERSEWGKEFDQFKMRESRPMNPTIRPTMTMPFHRPFIPMGPMMQMPSNQPITTKAPSMDSSQWAEIFEKAHQEANLTQSYNQKDELAKTAEMLLDNVDVEGNPKFRDSAFINMVKGFSNGDLTIEGDKVVTNNDKNIHSLKLDDTKLTSLNSNEIPSSMYTEEAQQRIQKNWAEEFIEAQEAIPEEPKTALTDLTDDEFEQAFKFNNWVDDYKNELLTINEDPQEINWDDLQKDWEKYNAKANENLSQNPLYDNYVFTKENPFLTAPNPLLETAMNSKDLATAIPALEAKVQMDPEDALAWHKLGIRQQENERESAAIAALRKAVELDPSLCDAWSALAVSYTNENCVNDAYDSLEAWIANNENYKHLLEGRQPKIDSERHDWVFNLYLDAVRANVTDSFDPEVQIGLGVLLNISEEYDKAVDCFESALSTRPNDYLLWNKLGATLANSQEPSKAMEAYFKALELNPTFIRARYNLAISTINLGQYHEAAEHLLAALDLQSKEKHDPEIPNNNIIGSGRNASSHVWDTLRMTLYMLDRTDLVEKCDAKDLNAFRSEFNF